MSEFKKGDKVFYKNRECEFICEYNGNAIILLYISGAYDYYQELLEVPINYISKEKIIPIEIQEYDEKIKEYKKEIGRLRKEKGDIESTVIKMRNDLSDKLKTHEAIKNVYDFLDKKITHFVIPKYGRIEIIEFKDFLTPDNKYDYHKEEMKLVSLFGKSNGDLHWRVNEYRDGSGSYTTVIPCISYDEAKKIATEYIEKYIEDDLKNNKTYYSSIRDCVEEHKLKPNRYKEYCEYIKKVNDKNKAEKINNLKKQIGELENE